jgi:hypothetical protein
MQKELLWDTVNKISKITAEITNIRVKITDLQKHEASLTESLEDLLGKKHGNVGMARVGQEGGPSMTVNDATLEILKTRFPQGATSHQIQEVMNTEYAGKVRPGARVSGNIYFLIKAGKVRRTGRNFFLPTYLGDEKPSDTPSQDKPVGFKLFDVPVRPPQRFSIGGH